MRLYFGTAACAVAVLLVASMATPPAPLLARQPSKDALGGNVVSLGAPLAASPSSDEPAKMESPPQVIDDNTPEPRASSLAALVETHSDAQAPDAEGRCLAAAVYFESKGEPLAGQLAVAQVMINRTQSGRFPETLCGVVKQSGQFSFVHGGQFPRINEDSKAWHTALAIGEIARGEQWQPMVGHAMFFHAKRVSPHWHATQVASLGHHVFYR